MKAHLLSKHAAIEERPLRLIDLERPKPAANEVLVKVNCCGVCRTDLHVVEGDLQTKTLPIIPGHQVVGNVAELGSAVKLFSEGDRVGIAWLRETCSSCEFCKNDKENLCESSLYTGYHEHGGYAEYAVVNENYAYKIPGQFSDTQAAPLLCAGIIGYRALCRSNLPEGGSLGIFGFGSSAHITMQVAKARGCKCFCVANARRETPKTCSEYGSYLERPSHSAAT